MFTGIIKAVGCIEARTEKGGDLALIVAGDLPWGDFEQGESIAVNGVCLTAVEFTGGGFLTDVSRETLAATALDGLGAGSAVNLEPSLALGERLGGHLVSGHVDCVGTVVKRRKDARSERFEVELPERYARYVARKGSICIDGVSLTINEVSGKRFAVNIIPHTLEHTIIRDYRAGTRVNIEVDLLMRYIERLQTAGEDADGHAGLTREQLEAYGYD